MSDLRGLLPSEFVMEAKSFRRLRNALAAVPEAALVAAQKAVADAKALFGSVGGKGFYVTNAEGLATIQVRGAMSKEFSLWGAIFGGQACTEFILSGLNAALADDVVKAILLVFDSPGGDVRGVEELVEALWAAKGRKPIRAIGSDRVLSAAFWVACQVPLFVGRNTLAGAVGVRMECEDDERAELNAGIERRVYASSEGKADPGDAAIQQLVDDLAANFEADVARGLGISPEAAHALADGLPYVGQRAVDLGYAAGIRTVEQLTGEMVAEFTQPPPVQVVVTPCDDPTEDIASAKSRKGANMEENAVKELLAAQLAPLNAKITALETENAALKTSNEATAKQAAELACADRKRALILAADAENKLPKLGKGREDALAILSAAWEQGENVATWHVKNLPVLGKRDGSVLAGTIATPAPSQGTGSKAPERVEARFTREQAAANDPDLIAEAKALAAAKGISILAAARLLTVAA